MCSTPEPTNYQIVCCGYALIFVNNSMKYVEAPETERDNMEKRSSLFHYQLSIKNLSITLKVFLRFFSSGCFFFTAFGGIAIFIFLAKTFQHSCGVQIIFFFYFCQAFIY